MGPGGPDDGSGNPRAALFLGSEGTTRNRAAAASTLEEKGFLERDSSISVHFFSSLVTRQDYAGEQLESLAEKLTAGSLAPLITQLVEHKKITRSEIDRIRAILDAHEEKQATKPKARRKGDSILSIRFFKSV